MRFSKAVVKANDCGIHRESFDMLGTQRVLSRVTYPHNTGYLPALSTFNAIVWCLEGQNDVLLATMTSHSAQ